MVITIIKQLREDKDRDELNTLIFNPTHENTAHKVETKIFISFQMLQCKGLLIIIV